MSCSICHSNRKLSKTNICYPCKFKKDKSKDLEKFKAQSKVNSKKSRKNNKVNIRLKSYQKFDKEKFLVGNDLDLEFIKQSFKKDCSYCGKTEITMTLDRIDNSKAHTKENCVPACYRCNVFRGSMPFQAWILIVPKLKEAKELGLLNGWKDKLQEDVVELDACPSCHKTKPWYSYYCSLSCSAKERPIRKIDWSEINLNKELETKSISEIAKELNVNYNTVKLRFSSQNRKTLNKKCIHCDNVRAKYNKYCSDPCAAIDHEKLKSIIDWSKIDLEEELKTLSVKQLALKLGCSKRALQSKIFNEKHSTKRIRNKL